MKYFCLFIFIIFALGSNALAVDFDHYFNTDSITTKPARSDYSSDEAYAADSIVYGVPRTCRWYSAYGEVKTQKGRIDDFLIGSNLRKSPNSNWYAANITPRMASGALSGFIYVRSNDGTIACGEKHLLKLGGSWSHGGKWYKTFDYVLKTKPSGNSPAKKTIPSTVTEPSDALKKAIKEMEKKEEMQDSPISSKPLERLKKLKKLLDSGLIDKSDYDKKKNEILKDL